MENLKKRAATPIADAWRRGLRPPDRRPIYEWAAEHVTLPSVIPDGGTKFDPYRSRHLLRIFEALQDDMVRRVTLMKPVRGAGSLVGDIWVLWTIANDPGPMMATFQTDPAAKDFAEDRLNPMMDMSPPVRELYPEDRHQNRTQEIKFRHGMPLYIQGPALGNLQAKGMRFLRNEEIWMWPSGRYSEVLGRIGDYEELGMSKIFDISQGGLTDDDLDVGFREGTQEEWFVPCHSCGHVMQGSIFGYRDDGSIWGLRWDDNEKTRNKSGDWIFSQLAPTVRVECEKCGHPHVDEVRTKTNWNLTGKYIAQNSAASPQNVSIHYSALITRSWLSLAEQLSKALNALRIGIMDPRITFAQKREARSWSEQLLDERKRKNTYEVNSDWPEEKDRALTVDRQQDGVHWGLVAAWSNSQARRLWYGKLYSEDEIKAKAAEFKVEPRHVFIDSGFEAKLVYAMCVRNDWNALKGDERKAWLWLFKIRSRELRVLRSYSRPVRGDPEIGQSFQGRAFARLMHWSNPTIKDRLKGLLDRGRLIEPQADPEQADEKEYTTQMRGQWRKPVMNKTTMRKTWIWVDNGNDHARDCWCMQIVFATIQKLLPDIETEPDESSPAAPVVETAIDPQA
jgi:hypothetical protein